MKVLVNGQLVEYKKEGRGRTIVLLHGWGMTLTTFDDLAKYLVGKGYEVLRFDFPGFGGSPKPADSWGVGEYVALTSSLLIKLKVKNVEALVGHSFGGRVIIKGVSSGQLKPKKVVLMDAAGVRPPRTAKKQALKAIAKIGKAATSLPGLRSLRVGLRQKLYETAGSSDYLNAGELQKIFLNTINEDLVPVLAKIKLPTLLIWGEDDTETPLKDGEQMRANIKNSDLIVVPGAGHFVYIDDPVAVEKELDGWL